MMQAQADPVTEAGGQQRGDFLPVHCHLPVFDRLSVKFGRKQPHANADLVRRRIIVVGGDVSHKDPHGVRFRQSGKRQ